MFVNKHFIYIGCVYLKKNKQYDNAKPSAHYFYVKTNILADFHIYISAPLKLTLKTREQCVKSVQRLQEKQQNCITDVNLVL